MNPPKADDDLIHETTDRVDIVDYKTDRGRHGEPEYRKQLSVYYHVATEVYPGREITTNIFYTETDSHQPNDPLGLNELRDIVESAETT